MILLKSWKYSLFKVFLEFSKFCCNRFAQFIGRVEKEDGGDDDQDDVEDEPVDEGPQSQILPPVRPDLRVAEMEQNSNQNAEDNEDHTEKRQIVQGLTV